MSPARFGVLRPGDWVEFDGAEYQVVALAATTVQLRSNEGIDQVMLVTHLMGSVGFAVIGAQPVAEVEPFGLFETLPAAAVAAAREWESHVIEVETGLPPDAAPGAVCRDGYDPAVTTLSARADAKAAELPRPAPDHQHCPLPHVPPYVRLPPHESDRALPEFGHCGQDCDVA